MSERGGRLWPALAATLGASASIGLAAALLGGFSPGARLDFTNLWLSWGLTAALAGLTLCPLAALLSLRWTLKSALTGLLGPSGQGRLQALWGPAALALVAVATEAARRLLPPMELDYEAASLVGVPAGLALLFGLHRLAAARALPHLGPIWLGALLAIPAAGLWVLPLFWVAPWLSLLTLLGVLWLGAAPTALVFTALYERFPRVISTLSILVLAFMGGTLAALSGIIPANAVAANGAGRAAIAAFRFLSDGDGDGFSAHFAGGDCDDDDPAIHPQGQEEPGPADENCLGGVSATSSAVERRLTGPAARPLDVVLISVDTLRADHFTPELMPHLWAFAASGLRFEWAFAPAPFTDLSLRAVFTGQPPSDFDLRGAFKGMDRSLPDLLAEAGYDTFALHAAPPLGELVTLGFRQLNDRPGRVHEQTEESAELLVQDALGLLKRPWPRPRLLWVHAYEPHHPYRAHAGFEDLGSDRVGRYRQEVAYTDQALAPLLAWLSTPEVAKKTVVVFFADHGEHLGEARRVGHDHTLVGPTLRVPLVIRAPGLAPGVRGESVSLTRLVPTILALLELPVEPWAPPLLPDAQGRLATPGFLAEARSPGPRASFVAWVEGVALVACEEESQLCQAYDLKADPLCLSPNVPDAAALAPLHQALDALRQSPRYDQRNRAFMARWRRR